MVCKAAEQFDAGGNIGSEANMAKLLVSEASWAAAEACMQTNGVKRLPKSMMLNVNSEKIACIKLRQFQPI